MKRAIFIAACIGFGTASTAGAEELPARLELACVGGGAANKADVATVNGWNSNGDFGSAQVHGQRSVGFEDQVNLWIDGGEGRIRMPRSMLPPIRGGEDGWFKIKSIEVSDREIIGSVAVNALNNPKLRVDRYTGAISISGKAGDFSGRCQKYDPATERRAF
ncbi:hypothetical protein [Brucella intermedia]|uniref:hypothetical protein n=1 Tax=Brucella intermedia TaxID=94625 RepID=UPI00244AFE32|nr:hypothetical protein [Brucella intermedia]WGG59357.1 hypothetical protein QA414_13780 [Brucella intermedia]